MPRQFKYQAYSPDGVTHKGVVAAESTDGVLDYLSEKDLSPISIKQISKNESSSLLGFFKGQDYENLIAFTNNLATLHRAGVPMLRALSITIIGPRDTAFNRAIETIRFDVQSGKSLAQAMSLHDRIFSRVYCSSIAAGEESGRLDDILAELSSMLEKELELNRMIKAALRYPIMVVGAIAGAITILMGMVVPRFAAFYSSFDSELPLPTRLVIGLSDAIIHYWPLGIALIVVAALILRKVASTQGGRLWLDTLILKIPVLGELVVKGNIARFNMLFHILFKAGIPIVRSLQVLQDSVKNTAIAAEIGVLRQLFQEGKDSSLTSAKFVFFPQMALQMMAVGLESGSLETTLAEVARYYHKQVQYTSQHLAAILEPLLTVILGIFVLVLALAIFLPMWNLIKVFGGP